MKRIQSINDQDWQGKEVEAAIRCLRKPEKIRVDENPL